VGASAVSSRTLTQYVDARTYGLDETRWGREHENEGVAHGYRTDISVAFEVTVPKIEFLCP